MPSNKKAPLSGFLILLTALTIGFIFSNSLRGPLESSAQSGRFLQYLAPILDRLLGQGAVTEHLIRKLAHFSEFALLGIELALPAKARLRTPLELLFATAFLDETIQIFTGRGAQIQDVWLDFAGGCTGLLLCTGFLLLIKKKR